MKKFKIFLSVVIAVLFLGLLSYVILKFSDDIFASGKFLTETEYFDTSGDKAAIIYNYGRQSEKALYREDKFYIPLIWVRAVLNDKFYFSPGENLLIYTLPEEILYSDLSTKGNDNKAYIIKEDEKIYLSIDLIRTYTDIYVEEYADSEVKRIFINDRWEGNESAEVKKNKRLRVEDSKKSNIVKELLKGDKVLIATDKEAGENIKQGWVKVKTEDGYVGFIEKKYLTQGENLIINSTFEKPVYSNISLPEPVVLGWHQVSSKEANERVEEVISRSPEITVISPTWFSLSDNQGNYTSIASEEYVVKAHEKGLQVWVLIDNFSKEVNSEILFADSVAREKLIGSLISDVKRYNIDGINLDFESLRQEAESHYIQFIRELSVACRREKIVLSVDVPVPAAYNMFYGREKIAEVADYVIVMGYDEHYSGGSMGSVASYNFVKEGIENSLKEVPKEKLINAVPFYTRLWTETTSGLSSEALGNKAALEWIDNNSVDMKWDDNLGQYYGEFEQADGKTYIWMEEERSLGLKVDLINQANLAGVAIWKLGLEDASLWEVIKKVQ